MAPMIGYTDEIRIRYYLFRRKLVSLFGIYYPDVDLILVCRKLSPEAKVWVLAHERQHARDRQLLLKFKWVYYFLVFQPFILVAASCALFAITFSLWAVGLIVCSVLVGGIGLHAAYTYITWTENRAYSISDPIFEKG